MRSAVEHWKAKGVDLSRVLYQAPPAPGVAIYNCEKQDHHLDQAMDNELIELSAAGAANVASRCASSRDIRNVHRTVGAMLSGEVAKRYGHAGLPEDTIQISLTRQCRRQLRRVPGARRHAGADRRCQRLCRQGTVRRPRRRAPSAGATANPTKTSSSAIPCCTARSPARRISRASPASASPCATPVRSRWWKAAATTAANT